MAAELLARDLARDLYQIDLRAAVSKYIGETERNLAESSWNKLHPFVSGKTNHANGAKDPQINSSRYLNPSCSKIVFESPG